VTPTNSNGSSINTDRSEIIRRRKEEHLHEVLGDVEARGPSRWEDVQLVHSALPEVDFEDIQLGTTFLNRWLDAPLMIAGMTGGHPMAQQLNAGLARAAQQRNLAMGVGSQRAALEDPSLAETYAVVREVAPSAYVLSNIGVAQLVEQPGRAPLTLADVHTALDMIGADALVVHLNFLEEVIQPEGDRRAAGALNAIRRLTEELGGRVPVVVKETGGGLAPAVAAQLIAAGVDALDVGGQGGTSFAAVEAQRAARRGDKARAGLGAVFREWGIPSTVSVATVAPLGVPVIATGGVRTGLDAARAIALGATLVGFARPMLQAIMSGEDQLGEFLDTLLLELRTAMFLTASDSIEQLGRTSPVIIGETGEWLRQITHAPHVGAT
jgi:isopentenyl-diphosphate delta-isomerase